MEKIKKGRRLVGAYFTLPDGKRVFMAKKRHKDIYRAGKKSISEALREGVAGWMIDAETLMNARSRGVDAVAVAEIDSRTIYVTDIANFYDYTKAGQLSGGNARYLPMPYWRKLLGDIRI